MTDEWLIDRGKYSRGREEKERVGQVVIENDR
jgi:hypothetical protein